MVMNPDVEMILCVPGPWKNRGEFVRGACAQTQDDFLFAGSVLACPGRNDHIPLDFEEADPSVAKAFEIAGQGKLSQKVLGQIGSHAGIVYLHFPVPII